MTLSRTYVTGMYNKPSVFYFNQFLQNGSEAVRQPGTEGCQSLPHSTSPGETPGAVHGDTMINV